MRYIEHSLGQSLIAQRPTDGYINGTAMCKACGKNMGNYLRNTATKEFLEELSTSMRIRMDELVVSIGDVKNKNRGTWIHPDVAVNLGQWCSPKFAVAVSRWVREWMQKKATESKDPLPYHWRRFIVNKREIPPQYFSILNCLTMELISPLEDQGYILPDPLVPDISEGKMFSEWLRSTKGINPDKFPVYSHTWQDGRTVKARLYPVDLYPVFIKHFHRVWMPQRAVEYFKERDCNALPYLPKLLEASTGQMRLL